MTVQLLRLVAICFATSQTDTNATGTRLSQGGATFKGVSGGFPGCLGSIACSSKLWVSETVVDMGKLRGIDEGGTGY
ncbi:hypothetical protein QUB70_01055 [Microcoleus sp. A003_D6]|uniref:hypothetical protein n=1 Tax=Microcoleus sp. A003_D6 TaxID=3055266 RepID=UPI002FCF5177